MSTVNLRATLGATPALQATLGLPSALSVTVQPGVPVPGPPGIGAAGITIDGGGSTPATGSKGYVQVPYAGTITGWTLLADQPGSAQITVLKSTYAGFPVTSSIVGTAPPSLQSQQNATSTTLTGWTTAIAASDILEFHLDSAAGITRLNLELQITKS
jgi:hypothetical protein